MKQQSLIGIRYSLRWFLLVILLIGVVGGLIGRRFAQDWAEKARQESERARQARHQAALRTLRHSLDWRTGKASRIHLDDPQLAPALADLPELEVLHVYRTSFGDDHARYLVDLTNVKEIIAFTTPLTDAGLIYLRNMRELETLELRETRITGSGFAHLAGLPKLRKVSLDKTLVDDEGLAGIGKVASLEELDLRSTPIRGAGLSELKGLIKMRSLHANGLHRDAISGLDELDQIERLELSCSGLTSRHIEQILGMASLRQLSLDDPQFDRDVLRSLKRFARLEILRLTASQPEENREPVIREEDVVWLSAHLPATDVVFALYCDSGQGLKSHPHLSHLCNQQFFFRGGVRAAGWSKKTDAQRFANKIQINGTLAETRP